MTGIVDTAALRALRERVRQCKGTPGEKEAAFDYGSTALAALPALLDEVERRRASDPLTAELVGALEDLNAAFLGIPINVPNERMPAILSASQRAHAAVARARALQRGSR